MAQQVLKNFHGTAVARNGRALVLFGPSGAGKSDLALRLIDHGYGLIGDDQLEFWRAGPDIMVKGDARLNGTIEVRGIGLVSVQEMPPQPVRLWVELAEDVPRLPQRRFKSLLDCEIPLLALNPFETSAMIKLDWCLADPEIIGRVSL